MKYPSAEAMSKAAELLGALGEGSPMAARIALVARELEAFRGARTPYTTGTRAYVALRASLETVLDMVEAHARPESASYVAQSRLCEAIRRAIARTEPSC